MITGGMCGEPLSRHSASGLAEVLIDSRKRARSNRSPQVERGLLRTILSGSQFSSIFHFFAASFPVKEIGKCLESARYTPTTGQGDWRTIE
jgi:hypothetical protein